jgi:hypothetical protein
VLVSGVYLCYVAFSVQWFESFADSLCVYVKWLELFHVFLAGLWTRFARG